MGHYHGNSGCFLSNIGYFLSNGGVFLSNGGRVISNGGRGGAGDENEAGQDAGSHVVAAILDFP